MSRTADSTQRALNELAKRRHEKMERRRAGALLVSLLSLVVLVSLAGHRTSAWGGGAGDAALRGGGGGREGDNFDVDLDGGGGRASVKKKRVEAEASDDGVGETKAEAFEPPPEEPLIPPGKEFLAPLRYFADVKSPRRLSTDTPFFFHVPRSGGQTVKDIVGKCLGKTLACEVGVRDGHGDDPVSF